MSARPVKSDVGAVVFLHEVKVVWKGLITVLSRPNCVSRPKPLNNLLTANLNRVVYILVLAHVNSACTEPYRVHFGRYAMKRRSLSV